MIEALYIYIYIYILHGIVFDPGFHAITICLTIADCMKPKVTESTNIYGLIPISSSLSLYIYMCVCVCIYIYIYEC